MELINHIEKYLGQIFYGWQDKMNEYLQVCLFKEQPQKGISTYLSIGLSHHIFPLGSQKGVRFELLLSLYSKYESDAIANVLINIGEYLVKHNKPLRRGEIIDMKTNFLLGDKARGLYCCSPVFFEEDFYVYYDMTPPVVFIWLMPVQEREINFIREKGWSVFEERLETSTCDFWDLNRNAIL